MMNFKSKTAAEGCWLTQAAAVDITQRKFYSEIMYSSDEFLSKWKEIGKAEYDAYQAELASVTDKEDGDVD